MPIYPGRRPKTHRVVVWAGNRSHEWIFEGTKRDAEKFEARKRLELDPAKSRRRGPLTFSEFAELVYEPHAETHLAKSTWHSSRVYQVATLTTHLGRLRLTEITATHVEAFKRARLADRTAPSSINNELRVLRTMLNVAAQLGHEVTDLKFKRLPQPPSERVQVWSETEILRLFEAARALCPELVGMLVFLANTGCRKGEALAAEWTWIDEPAEMIHVPANEVWRPKSGKARDVPLSRALRAVLAGPRAHPRWVFPARHGGRYAQFPEEQWREIRDAAKLTGGPHTLRHSFASMFLRATNGDMFLLAQVLGHSHTRITELYSHLLPGHLDRARNAVDLAPALRSMARPMATKAGRAK